MVWKDCQTISLYQCLRNSAQIVQSLPPPISYSLIFICIYLFSCCSIACEDDCHEQFGQMQLKSLCYVHVNVEFYSLVYCYVLLSFIRFTWCSLLDDVLLSVVKKLMLMEFLLHHPCLRHTIGNLSFLIKIQYLIWFENSHWQWEKFFCNHVDCQILKFY